jgi:hypothetical protein
MTNLRHVLLQEFDHKFGYLLKSGMSVRAWWNIISGTQNDVKIFPLLATAYIREINTLPATEVRAKSDAYVNAITIVRDHPFSPAIVADVGFNMLKEFAEYLGLYYQESD